MFNYETQYLTADNTPVLFTVSDLADYLGIGKNRAYELLRKDIIHGFKIGCIWKVSKVAVDKYISEKSRLI